MSSSMSDLRGHDVDSKRAKESKRKWSSKSRAPVVRLPPNDTRMHQQRQSQRTALREVRSRQNEFRRSNKERKHFANDDTEDVTDISSCNVHNEIPAVSTHKTAPDSEITYSYDAPKGPAANGEIFGMILAKAEAAFEDNQTSELVQAEYDVVEDKDDPTDIIPIVEDDGYELL